MCIRDRYQRRVHGIKRKEKMKVFCIILIVTLIFSAEARMIMPRKVQNTPEPELDLSNATPCERSFLAIHSKLSEIAQHLTGNIFALSGDFTELFWLVLKGFYYCLI
eukprot:TRINITY_DN334_c0_g1_i2.p2 TRINITY_DN334_c0_g1~~TRINITY_DN334_c0_g1_i2.p2  ORF type:complete len:107 (-),score=21.52 TRINITY_DN334_c0_g1_i2:203-523(-)